MKYIVTSRHSEDVGLPRPVRTGQEFDDKDIPDTMKNRIKELEARGSIVKASQAKKSGGE
jgi:hypothetical protein